MSRDHPAQVELPGGTGPVIVSTHPDPVAPAAGAALSLRPHEAMVLELPVVR